MPPAGPTTHPIGKLSSTQVAEIARNAGFPDKEIPMAVEIARLESGFDPNKEGVLDPRDKGLYQINSHFHPEVLKINWRDPHQNTDLAYQIWTHGGWSQWSTYNKALLTVNVSDSHAAAKSAKSSQQQTVSGVAGAVGDTLLAPFKPIADTVKFLSVGRNWGRIGMILIGGVILLLGVNELTKPYTEGIREAARTAVGVAAKAA